MSDEPSARIGEAAAGATRATGSADAPQAAGASDAADSADAPQAAGASDAADAIESIAPLSRPVPPVVGRVLAVVAALCLIAACFSHRWLANRYIGDFGFSPLSFQRCDGACVTVTNFEVREIAQSSSFAENRVSLAFPVAGLATFVVLLVAAVGLLVAAALAVGGLRPELPIAPTTVALLGLMLGLISGCVFVATKPGDVGAVGVAGASGRSGSARSAGSRPHRCSPGRFDRQIRISCTTS